MGARDYIKAEMERSPSGIDVNVLASNVIRSVPRGEMPAYVQELTVHAIQGMNKEYGGRAAMVMLAPAHEQSDSHRPGRSWTDRLAPYRTMLNRSQMVEGKVYRLGDLTAELLRQVAEVRRTQATTMVRNAEWFEKVAAACEEHGVTKVDDLSDVVLEALHQERRA